MIAMLSRYAFLLTFVAVCSSGAQTSKPEPFLVNPNLPFTYLTVDHVGYGALEAGHRRQRVWLLFHNNCRQTVNLYVNGPPLDAPEDKLTVMYEFVVPVERGVIVTSDGKLPKRKKVMLPSDTMSEVGSTSTIQPGEAVLFSVPASSFNADWEIHIPFWFRLPLVKGATDENAAGGEPQMFLSYNIWNLPNSIRKSLVSKVLP
ncbi:MAG: hypothetical protein ABI197_02735 [Granulicella sp.]